MKKALAILLACSFFLASAPMAYARRFMPMDAARRIWLRAAAQDPRATTIFRLILKSGKFKRVAPHICADIPCAGIAASA